MHQACRKYLKVTKKGLSAHWKIIIKRLILPISLQIATTGMENNNTIAMNTYEDIKAFFQNMDDIPKYDYDIEYDQFEQFNDNENFYLQDIQFTVSEEMLAYLLLNLQCVNLEENNITTTNNSSDETEYIEVDDTLDTELKIDPIMEKTKPSKKRKHEKISKPPLIGISSSIPFVINKILFSRRGSMEKTINALEEGRAAALKEFVENQKYEKYITDKENPTKEDFGSLEERSFTHPVILETLKLHGISITKVNKLTELNALIRNNKTILVYGSLNPEFVCKRYPFVKNIDTEDHVILVKKGVLHCVHLKHTDGKSPLKLRANKALKTIHNKGWKKAEENSYLDIVKAAFIIGD